MAERGYDAYYPPTATVPVALTHASDFYDNGAIRTLFIAGLPDDVKAREIHNLFRRRPGFDSCQLKYTGRGNQVVAFATFFNHQSAIAAMHSLNVRVYGRHIRPSDQFHFAYRTGQDKFQKETYSRLILYLKPNGGCSEPYVVMDNRPKDKSNEQETSSNDGDDESEEESPSEQEDPSEDEDPSGEEDGNSGSDGNLAKSGETADNESAMGGGGSVPGAENSQEAVNGDPKPCSTLFIANLGPNCSREELEQVLNQYPGFVALRIRARGGNPLAFADFEEIEQATKAMEGLQGVVLTSSDHGGMSIEYARSKMRKHVGQQGQRATLRI